MHFPDKAYYREIRCWHLMALSFLCYIVQIQIYYYS